MINKMDKKQIELRKELLTNKSAEHGKQIEPYMIGG